MLLGENRVALHCLLGKDERPGRGEESCVRMKLAEGCLREKDQVVA